MQNLQSSPFRAMLPYYILWDLDLNANHYRLYGLIEQMESSPSTKPFFSYEWLANQLGIARRNAIKCAKTLVDKGYIEHIQVKKNQWIWKTKKYELEVESPDCSTSASDAERHPGVMLSDTPLVTLSDTHKSQKIKSQNTNSFSRVRAHVDSPTPKKNGGSDLSLVVSSPPKPDDIEKSVMDEFLLMRKNAKLSNSNLVMGKLHRELEKCESNGVPANEALKMCLCHGWKMPISSKLIANKPKAAPTKMEDDPIFLEKLKKSIEYGKTKGNYKNAR